MANTSTYAVPLENLMKEAWLPSWVSKEEHDPRAAMYSLEESTKILEQYPLVDPFGPLDLSEVLVPEITSQSSSPSSPSRHIKINDLLTNTLPPANQPRELTCDFPGGCYAPSPQQAKRTIVDDLFDASQQYPNAIRDHYKLCQTHLQANAGTPHWDRQRLAFAMLQLARLHRDHPALQYTIMLKQPESTRLCDILDFGSSARSDVADLGGPIARPKCLARRPLCYWLRPQQLADVFVRYIGADRLAYEALLVLRWVFECIESGVLGGMPAIEVLPQAHQRRRRVLRDPEQERLLMLAAGYGRSGKLITWVEERRSRNPVGLERYQTSGGGGLGLGD